MTDFHAYLDEFVREMENKFQERHDKQHRQGRKSVLDKDFMFSEDLSISHIESHFSEEIQERKDAKNWVEMCDEDIDVANMAFLDWAVRISMSRSASNKDRQ